MITFHISAETQLWKLDGTTLINKKGKWTSNDEWKFVPDTKWHNGTMFFIENVSNNKVSVVKVVEFHHESGKVSIPIELLKELYATC